MNRATKFGAVALAAVLLTGSVTAAQSAPATAPATGPLVGTESQRVGTNNTDPLSGLWQTLGALAVVIALIFLIRFAARRWGVSPSGGPGERIEVLARRGLTGRHEVVLLRVRGREMLVGAGPESLTLLAEFPPDVNEVDAEPKDA